MALKERVHKYPGTSKAFTVSASVGDVVIVGLCAANLGASPTCSDDLGNTYTKVKQTNPVVLFRCVVSTGGTPTITVNSNGGNDEGLTCYMFDGQSGNTDDVQGVNGTGSENPLEVSLARTHTCTVVCFWGNEGADRFSSFTGSLTLGGHDSGHYDADGYSTGVAAATSNFGANGGSSFQAQDAVVAIALEESGGGGGFTDARFRANAGEGACGGGGFARSNGGQGVAG